MILSELGGGGEFHMTYGFEICILKLEATVSDINDIIGKRFPFDHPHHVIFILLAYLTLYRQEQQ